MVSVDHTCFNFSLFVSSESELRVEGAGRPSAALRSRLRSSSFLSSDPDSHLSGFPGRGLPLDPKNGLVLEVRVSAEPPQAISGTTTHLYNSSLNHFHTTSSFKN